MEFDIKRDNQFACFCQACLVGKTEQEISRRDTRYCLTCQPFLETEYGQNRQRYTPIPCNRQNPPEDTPHSADIQVPTGEQETKMSTLNSPSPKVDIFRPRGRPKTYKKCVLPDDKIKQLHEDGMGAKAIATRLKTEEGIDVSYKTIQRVLSGERR